MKTKAQTVTFPLFLYRALSREKKNRIPKTSISSLVVEAILEKYGKKAEQRHEVSA